MEFNILPSVDPEEFGGSLFKEVLGALIMPIRKRVPESLKHAAWYSGTASCVEHGSRAFRSGRQLREQGYVVATTEEHERVGHAGGQFKVLVGVLVTSLLEFRNVAGLAEGYVVVRRQIVCPDQPPSGRQDIGEYR